MASPKERLDAFVRAVENYRIPDNTRLYAFRNVDANRSAVLDLATDRGRGRAIANDHGTHGVTTPDFTSSHVTTAAGTTTWPPTTPIATAGAVAISLWA